MMIWKPEQAGKGKTVCLSGIIKHRNTGEAIRFTGVGELLRFVEKTAERSTYVKPYKPERNSPA